MGCFFDVDLVFLFWVGGIGFCLLVSDFLLGSLLLTLVADFVGRVCAVLPIMCCLILMASC